MSFPSVGPGGVYHLVANRMISSTYTKKKSWTSPYRAVQIHMDTKSYGPTWVSSAIAILQPKPSLLHAPNQNPKLRGNQENQWHWMEQGTKTSSLTEFVVSIQRTLVNLYSSQTTGTTTVLPAPWHQLVLTRHGSLPLAWPPCRFFVNRQVIVWKFKQAETNQKKYQHWTPWFLKSRLKR